MTGLENREGWFRSVVITMACCALAFFLLGLLIFRRLGILFS